MRKVIATALVAGAVAVPAAMAHESVRPDHPVKKEHPAKRVPVVSMVFRGIVLADATDGSVTVKAWMRGSNKHARRSLMESGEMIVKLDGTRLRGFILNEEGEKVFTEETFADLKAGDRVRFMIRAKKGTPAADLPAAKWLKDFNGFVNCEPTPPTEPTPTEPTPDPVPTEPTV